jgi:hypothetical protein
MRKWKELFMNMQMQQPDLYCKRTSAVVSNASICSGTKVKNYTISAD